MGKKEKKQQINGNKHEEKKGGSNIYLIAASIIFISIVVYVATNSISKKRGESDIAMTENTGNSKLKETRPVLPAAIWKGKTAEAYETASQIPAILDAQYCYCDCSKNPRFNHKSLLTCFTDNHGANCDICQNEVFASFRLFKKGFSIAEITKEIDKEFSQVRHLH